jgi:dihydrodipicolinate synthase/N-acetylneuraminate lyase
MGLFGSTNRWEGFLACPLTPYRADGGIDEDVHRKQVEFLIGRGAPAICVLMHLAESLNLTEAERRRVAELTVEVVAGRVPVVVHVSCPGTDQTVALALHAESVGADGVVVASPYYWKPDHRSQLAHFTAVGQAIDGSLIVYSSPSALGVAVTPALAEDLIERLPNLHAVKEASHHLPTFADLAHLTSRLRPDLSLFSGLDYMLPNRVCGGTGTLSACGLVAPRLVAALWDAVSCGDFARAQPLQDRVSRLLGLLLPGYPAGIKAAAEILGRPLGPTRLPLPVLSADEKRALASELDRAGLLDDEPFGWDPSAGPDPELARKQAGIDPEVHP